MEEVPVELIPGARAARPAKLRFEVGRVSTCCVQSFSDRSASISSAWPSSLYRRYTMCSTTSQPRGSTARGPSYIHNLLFQILCLAYDRRSSVTLLGPRGGVLCVPSL